MKGFFRFGSPVIRLAVEGRKIETLLDTGFNGHIILLRLLNLNNSIFGRNLTLWGVRNKEVH